jgi:hypothetical protein
MEPLSVVSSGATILAVTGRGEAVLGLSGALLSTRCLSATETEETARCLAQGLASLHSINIYLGSDINAAKVLLLYKTSGEVQAVFKTEKALSINKRDTTKENEDIDHFADLLCCIWSSGIQDNLTFTQREMILTMKERNPGEISMAEIAGHVAFWPQETVMDFLTSASEVLELKQRIHLAAVEADGQQVVGGNWLDRLDPVLRVKVINDSRKRRVYDETSVTDLLRVTRNLASHYYNLSPEVRGALGPSNDLGSMWTRLFPRLLLHVHRALHSFHRDTNCRRIQKFYD